MGFKRLFLGVLDAAGFVINPREEDGHGSEPDNPSYIEIVRAEFARIKNREFKDTEQVKYDIAPNLVNGDIYTGVADEAAVESDATWNVIRTYFDANGNPNQERIQLGIRWDQRTAGW